MCEIRTLRPGPLQTIVDRTREAVALQLAAEPSTIEIVVVHPLFRKCEDMFIRPRHSRLWP